MSTEYTRTELNIREDIIVTMASIMRDMTITIAEIADVDDPKIDAISLFGLMTDAMRTIELAAENCPTIREKLGVPNVQ